MSIVWTIARREIGSLFRLPVGWIVIALFCFLCAMLFVRVTLAPGEPATLRYFFGLASWLLIPIAPAVSMRLLSDELKSGTIESLRTSPVSDTAVIWGKFLGASGFLLLMLVPTLVFPMILWYVADPAPDLGPILTGYLSLALVGMLYVAIGTLASALTSSQTLAFLGTLMFLVIVMLLSSVVAENVGNQLLQRSLLQLNIGARVADFAKGIVDSTHLAFFLGGTVWFLALATISLEARRWR